MHNVLYAPPSEPRVSAALRVPDAPGPTQTTVEAPVSGYAAAEVRSALVQLLASQEFCKAQRMSRLLCFLVEKGLAGAIGETGEYAIGIQVFDRDVGSYNTGDDPIVRVQVGRLRERLKTYYGATGARADLRFSIPIGSYMPVIRRTGAHDEHFPRSHLLAILPLKYFTQDVDGVAFTQGLSEELSYQLFKSFGSKIVSHTFTSGHETAILKSVTGPGVSHLLEGSVRVNGDLIRTSLRLVDASAGCIAWSEQFDNIGPFAIVLQEELSVAICCALKLYFSHG